MNCTNRNSLTTELYNMTLEAKLLLIQWTSNDDTVVYKYVRTYSLYYSSRVNADVMTKSDSSVMTISYFFPVTQEALPPTHHWKKINGWSHRLCLHRTLLGIPWCILEKPHVYIPTNSYLILTGKDRRNRGDWITCPFPYRLYTLFKDNSLCQFYFPWLFSLFLIHT